MSEQEGMTTEKEDFNQWYNEVILKSGLAEHSSVSGCMVVRPRAYRIWELIKDRLDSRFKDRGVENAYFPVFIPEHLLEKESEHVEGFSPEVAWVTHSGDSDLTEDSELGEKLAIRPTSETIMYDSYKDWIRSWRDLPLKINQWVNAVRWEFKHATLFLRTREFLWQEGHTAFASKEEAEEDVQDAVEDYRDMWEDHLAIPMTIGLKTEKEKFPGADYTVTLEAMMPDGKVIQGCTSHHLGQNFSKPFDITFLDENEEEKYVYQNSWGFTTRSIGVMIAVHGDDQGLVIPPKVAPTQVVVIPIYQEDNRDEVVDYARQVAEELDDYRVEVDDRDEHSPGFKFNEWELKGVPLRIEIGPNEVEEESVTFVRRDTGENDSGSREELGEKTENLLGNIQYSLFQRAKEFEEERTKDASSTEELREYVEGNRVRANWCGKQTCEDEIKDETGAKISCLPYDENEPEGTCIWCTEDAEHVAYFAKSY